MGLEGCLDGVSNTPLGSFGSQFHHQEAESRIEAEASRLAQNTSHASATWHGRNAVFGTLGFHVARWPHDFGNLSGEASIYFRSCSETS